MGDQFDMLFEGHKKIDVAEEVLLHLVIDVHLQHAAGLLDCDRIFGKVAYVIQIQALLHPVDVIWLVLPGISQQYPFLVLVVSS